MRIYNDDLDFSFQDYDGEDSACEDCPKCGRHYDEVDYEYQSCSKCGWDEENKKWGESIKPSSQDYLNGDADILTGWWW